jgi:TonB family protein
MHHWSPISEATQACPQAAQSLLRDWLPGWCGSIVLHGVAVCCFVATAEYGPQVWPVARGRSSVASAPSIDARAGGVLVKFEQQAPPMAIETIDAPENSESDQVRSDPRIVMEATRSSSQLVAREEIEQRVAVLLSQLADLPTKSPESSVEPIVVRVDPVTIRDQELLRAIQPSIVERNPSPVAPTENGSSTSEGNATSNSAASAASAASNGAEDNPLPQPVATNAAPPYPEEARAAGLQGKVTLRLRIGVDGRVESLKVVVSSGTPSLDESALATVKQWRFEPARRLGRPVAMDVKTSVKFEIEAE